MTEAELLLRCLYIGVLAYTVHCILCAVNK